MSSCGTIRLAVTAFALLLFSFSLSTAVHADNGKVARSTIIIPFVPLHDHGVPLIKVRLNDQLDGTFMIDTGDSGCMISKSFAAKLGMKPQPAEFGGVLPYLFGDDPTQAMDAYAKSLQIGRLMLPNTHFFVISDDSLANFGEQHIDGIIGGPILSNFAMYIDYPRRFIALVNPGNLTDQERANIHLEDAAVLPLAEDKEYITAITDESLSVTSGGPNDTQVSDTGVTHHLSTRSYTFTTDAKISMFDKTAKATLTVDTGDPVTSIPFDAGQKLNPVITSYDTGSTIANGFGLFGVASVDHFTVSALDLQNFTVEFPVSKSTDIPPLLGEDILSYCTVLFDFPAKKLYIKPVMPPILPGAVKINPRNVLVARVEDAALDLSIFPGDGLATDTTFDGDDVAGAIDAQNAKMKGDATDASLYLAEGFIYHADRQNDLAQTAFAKAAELYQQQVASKPHDLDAQYHLAESFSLSGKIGDAEKIARSATTTFPNQAKAWDALGDALETKALMTETGSPFPPVITEDDILDYTQIVARLKQTPLSAEAISSIKSDIAEAISSFDKAVALAPDDPSVYKERSSNLLDTNLGIVLPNRQIQGTNVDPFSDAFSAPYFSDLDTMARLSNDPDDIGSAMDADVIDAEHRSNSHVDLRSSNFWKSLPNDTRQKIQKAIDHLNLLAKSSDSAVALKAQEMVGEAQHDYLKDDKSAESTFTTLVTAHPDQGAAVDSLVELLSNQSRYDDLMTILTNAEKVKPTAQIHLAMARTYIRLGKPDLAIPEAEAALKMKPDSYQCNIVVAALLTNKPDSTSAELTEAKACLDKAQVALGNHPDISDQSLVSTELAIFQCITGDVNDSAQTLLTVLSKDRTNTQARNVLGAMMM